MVVIPSQNEGFYNQMLRWLQKLLVVIPSQNEGFYNVSSMTFTLR